MGFFYRFNGLSSNILLTFSCYFDNPQMPLGEAFEQKLSAQFKCPAYARLPLPPHSLTLIFALHINIFRSTLSDCLSSGEKIDVPVLMHSFVPWNGCHAIFIQPQVIRTTNYFVMISKTNRFQAKLLEYFNLANCLQGLIRF